MTTVLVVEDEDDLRLLARMTLERAGFEVVEASTGTAALAMLSDQVVDVVVLDLRIPRPDGWEVLAWIRETGLGDRVKVVVVSAHVDAATEAKARSMACLYLPKPYQPADLIEAVRDGGAGEEP